MIPDAAVEAAARVLGYDPDWHGETDREENLWFLSRARQTLEAAAPHMRQAFFLEMNLRAVEAELKTPFR